MRLRNSFIISAIALLLWSGGLFSQTGDETYNIADITVEGAKYSDPQTIIALSGLRSGMQITLPRDVALQRAIVNLWERKQFSDIEIIVDEISPIAGVFLTIRVEEYPRLDKIIVNGDDEVKKSDIEEAVDRTRGDILSPYEINLVVKSVQRLYREEGFEHAKIETRTERTKNNFANLILDISEGIEFKVREITFEGNSAFKDKQLAKSFEETKVPPFWKIWDKGVLNLSDYEKDLDLLKAYYRKHGYLDAAIVSDTIIYDTEKESAKIRIELTEGGQFFVGDIEFQGSTVYPEEILLRRLDFEKGEIFDEERFQYNLNGNPEQTDALSLYLDNGYLMARFIPEYIRVAEDTVDLQIKVFEGERIRIRRVEIAGNSKTKDKVIRRELYTIPGDYFDRSAIIRSVRALGVLNYFNPETLQNVQPKQVDEKNFDILYSVEEKSSDMVNASVGYAGYFGLTFSVGLTITNFAIGEPLKGGAGQILNFNAESGMGSRYQNFSIGFTEPWLMDEPTTVGANLYYSWINYGYQLRRRGIRTNIGRRFRWPDDYWRGDWSVTVQENYVTEAGGLSAYYREGLTNEVTVSQKFSRTSVDNVFFPTVGSRFSFMNQWAMGSIGLGTDDYLKTEINYSISQPLLEIEGNNRLVFYLSSQMGYIASFRSDTSISPIELYYMGGNGLSGFGVTPLRGYDDRQVGSYYGGRVMAKHTAELRFAVSLNPMPIYAYAFAEAGNVWDNLNVADPFSLNRSAGVGVQVMMMPIGLLGFSYGYGFDMTNSGKEGGWKFLIHFGQNM